MFLQNSHKVSYNHKSTSRYYTSSELNIKKSLHSSFVELNFAANEIMFISDFMLCYMFMLCVCPADLDNMLVRRSRQEVQQFIVINTANEDK